MSKLLGISRPSLRQAYKALSILGITRAVPGDGTYISDSTSKILSVPLTFLMLMRRISLDDIFEFRMMLEAVLASLAAARASNSEVQAMASQIETMGVHLDDKQKDEYLLSEYEFHNCIAKAAHNNLLMEIIGIVGGLLCETRKALVNVIPDRRKDLEQHRAILVAIAAHDGEAAAYAMRHHLWQRFGARQEEGCYPTTRSLATRGVPQPVVVTAQPQENGAAILRVEPTIQSFV
jgi:GntR family transcriptional repressor for pyruvate dehydrogenase complex